MSKRALTGIKPTGILHIGNYLGSIRPAFKLASSGYDAFYFIANYHAITTLHNKQELEKLTYEHTAAWLAFGAQEQNITLYLQSDIPEIFELAWILSCFSTKGLLERAHAYKDAVARGDKVINHGLFSYPVLMAADIICFDADFVPVGKDQKQHVEIARDIAGTFNNTFGKPVLKQPQPLIQDDVMVVPGLDGQKMSKSYNNVIPVFASPDEIRKLTARIKTDSSSVEAPKDPDKCTIYNLYKLFATEVDAQVLKQKYLAGGMSWKEAKDLLAEALVKQFEKPRQRYNEIIKDTDGIKAVLKQNAQKARVVAEATLTRVRNVVGIV